ncbi:MAG: hypothetical protein WCP98_21555 [Actinomycetes bacterium]
MPRFRLLLAVTLAVAMCAAGLTAFAGPAAAYHRIQKGIAYTGYWGDAYAGAASDRSLSELRATGADWASMLVTGYQPSVDSTTIDRTSDRTPTDASLIRAIRRARALHLSVMLKPHVDLSEDPAHWRGEIGQSFGDVEWAAWFASYRAFILHYAQLATDTDCEQFSVGCELDSTVAHEAEWRAIIADVRSVYHGALTYADDMVQTAPDAIAWWDAVDLIGQDAYPTLTDKPHPTVADLLRGWRTSYMPKLKRLAERWGKPVILTEIGYRSVHGGAQDPWSWQRQGPPDMTVQARAYEAALTAVAERSWIRGMYWWQWEPDPNVGGPRDTGYSPHDKPAEKVLHRWYADRLP